MRSLQEPILAARDGDLAAFTQLVRRFSRMAVGYAYSRLRDFQLAEDAAQEAMIEMHRSIARLKRPEAFTAILRRNLIKQCDRITRPRLARASPVLPRNDGYLFPFVNDPAPMVRAITLQALRAYLNTNHRRAESTMRLALSDPPHKIQYMAAAHLQVKCPAAVRCPRITTIESRGATDARISR